MDVDAERARAEPVEGGRRQRAVRRGGFAAGRHGGHDPIVPARRSRPRHGGGITPDDVALLATVRALDPMLVGRPHVDLARIASALCPGC
ncbi:putative leader peptide [Actinomycetospora sp.]|uniref:putative leader peptide n=1 Tax=Actinomycetospora sp. TaxID=1872135 RepID=UPI0039C85605